MRDGQRGNGGDAVNTNADSRLLSIRVDGIGRDERRTSRLEFSAHVLDRLVQPFLREDSTALYSNIAIF